MLHWNGQKIGSRLPLLQRLAKYGGKFCDWFGVTRQVAGGPTNIR